MVADTVEELVRVIVLAEIGDPRCVVDGREVRAVEGAREVLRDAAAQGRAGVDANEQEVHVCAVDEVFGCEQLGLG